MTAVLLLMGDNLLAQGQICINKPNNRKKMLWMKMSVSVDAKCYTFGLALVAVCYSHTLGVKELLFS